MYAKLFALVFLLLGCFRVTHAQSYFRGRVIDKTTREPVEFAVISDTKTARKTMSDADGNFMLKGSKPQPSWRSR